MKREEFPTYLRRLLESGWTPSPGEMVEVQVYHDPDCPHLAGGVCRVTPTLRWSTTTWR